MTRKKDTEADAEGEANKPKDMRNLQLRKGIYYLRIMVNGKRRFLSTECRDKKAAIRRADEMKVELRDQTFNWAKAPCPTFADWAGRYEKTYSANKASAKRDAQVLAHAVPYFGKTPLDGITQSQCVGYLNLRATQPNARKRLPAQGTLTREHSFLSAVFNRAVQEGLLAVNPWKGLKRTPYAAKVRVLSHSEQPKLLAELNEEYQRLVTVAIGTGLREKGLLGVTPNDVSPLERLIHLPGRLAKGGKARDIPLLPGVEAALHKQATTMGVADDQPFFPKDDSGVRMVLARACKRAGIPRLSLHDLRRTFGTRCALANMAPAVTQRIMGHASIEVTMKHYVHIQQRDLVAAMERIDLGLAGGEARVVSETVSAPKGWPQRAVNE